jgi:GNAT superfamily N-acetyltransferase
MNEVGVDAWIADQQAGHRGPSLAICTVGDDRLLGKIALRVPGRPLPATACAAIRESGHPVGELSYWVLPDARGRGVATAAVRAMLERVRGMTGVGRSFWTLKATTCRHCASPSVGAERQDPERAEVDRQGLAPRWPCSSFRSSDRAPFSPHVRRWRRSEIPPGRCIVPDVPRNSPLLLSWRELRIGS